MNVNMAAEYFIHIKVGGHRANDFVSRKCKRLQQRHRETPYPFNVSVSPPEKCSSSAKIDFSQYLHEINCKKNKYWP